MGTFQDGLPLTSTNSYKVSFSPENLFGFQGSPNYSFLDSSNSKSTAETPNSSAETNVTPTNGITEVQGDPQYGNYLNIGNLSAKDRKFIRQSGGYQFVGSDGKVYNIAPGTSRKDMRKWYKQEKRAQEIARRRAQFGGTTQFENSDLQRIYDAGVQNPNAQFISYTQKETPEQPTNTPKYTYRFTGTKDSNNQYIALMNRLRSNDSEWTGNYAIDNVITNESVNNYLKDTLGNDWTGELNNNIYQKLLDKNIIDQDYLTTNNITLTQEVPTQENATPNPTQENATSTKNTNTNQKVNYLAGAPTKKVDNAIFSSWENDKDPMKKEAYYIAYNHHMPHGWYLVGYTNDGRPVIYNNGEYAVWQDTRERKGYIKTTSKFAWDNNKKYFTWHK